MPQAWQCLSYSSLANSTSLNAPDVNFGIPSRSLAWAQIGADEGSSTSERVTRQVRVSERSALRSR